MYPLGTSEIGATPGDDSRPQGSVRLLQELARALATAIESLQTSQAPQVDDGINFYDEVRRFEVALIERALDAAGGQQKRAAYLLGLKTTTLNAKIKIYGIQSGRRRPGASRVALVRRGA